MLNICNMCLYCSLKTVSSQCVMAVIRVAGGQKGSSICLQLKGNENHGYVILNCCLVLGLQLSICHCLYSSWHKIIYQFTLNF